jgi:site-specific recombinase XerD
MHELIKYESLKEKFPNVHNGLEKIFKIFEEVCTFSDIERVFLKGAGLSPRTYKTYLQAVKSFYAYTHGKHPLQIIPSDIESWFDWMVENGLDYNTCHVRVAGLKKFFKGVEKVVPIFESPFNRMDERLKKKLSRKKSTIGMIHALTEKELNNLIEWLVKEED